MIGDRLFRFFFLEHSIGAEEKNYAKDVKSPAELLYNGNSQKDE